MGLGGEPNAVVARVVDGDTIVVTTGGIEENVRLMGIDTPETVKPGTPVECFGKAASAHTAELLPEGTAVVLERDVEARDRYDRLLAYMHRAEDGLFVNMALVEGGFGQAAPYPPNVAYRADFAAAGRRARADQTEGCGANAAATTSTADAAHPMPHPTGPNLGKTDPHTVTSAQDGPPRPNSGKTDPHTVTSAQDGPPRPNSGKTDPHTVTSAQDGPPRPNSGKTDPHTVTSAQDRRELATRERASGSLAARGQPARCSSRSSRQPSRITPDLSTAARISESRVSR